MRNPRRYGRQPFRVAVIHGGPGAPGEMAPVARELSSEFGVLEPLQTATTVQGQARELRAALERHGSLPMTLIGSSWGATLGFILAAGHPAIVGNLILVGCPPFEAKYAAGITETRMSRLSREDRREAGALMSDLDDPSVADKPAAFAQLGALIAKADAYDPLPQDDEVLEYQYEVNQRVWREAAEMRGNAELLEMGKRIRCPVLAIHGDYDPHPAEGVQKPLSRVLRDFRFVPLEYCGHHPWEERQARDSFYELLRKELRQALQPPAQ